MITNRVKVFLYYALKDEQDVKEGLMPQLNSLQMQGRIELLGHHTILAGKNAEEEIEGYLNEAQIILLVISARFMSDLYCYASIMIPAIKLHKDEKAVVIPILLSHVSYDWSPIAKIKPLPTNAIPIMNWHNPNDAYADVLNGIREIIAKIPPPSLPSLTSTFPTKLEDLKRPPLTYRGHENAISAIAFSPHEETLASASMDKTIRLWNANTDKPVHTIAKEFSDEVTSVAFSPDGKILAGGSLDKIIKLWNSHTQQLEHTLVGHTKGVLAIAFSPDGKILASASLDKTIKLWNVASGQVIITLKGHTASVLSVAFSHDSSRLASGGKDKSVRVWDIGTGECLHLLKRHSKDVLAVVFSSNGHMLISGSTDKTIRVWNRYTGGELFPPLTAESGILSLAMHPGVQPLLASGHQNGEITIWDLQAKKQLYKFPTDDSDAIWSLAFSRNGLKLASGSGEKGGGVSIWCSKQKVAPQVPPLPSPLTP